MTVGVAIMMFMLQMLCLIVMLYYAGPWVIIFIQIIIGFVESSVKIAERKAAKERIDEMIAQQKKKAEDK